MFLFHSKKNSNYKQFTDAYKYAIVKKSLTFNFNTFAIKRFLVRLNFVFDVLETALLLLPI